MAFSSRTEQSVSLVYCVKIVRRNQSVTFFLQKDQNKWKDCLKKKLFVVFVETTFAKFGCQNPYVQKSLRML